MTKKLWKAKIKAACIEAGTYKAFFQIVIDELADILDRRDAAKELYNKDPRPVIEFKNTLGAENIVKNPLLMLIEDMNKNALAYWRDLGLTPAGLRKLNERTFRESGSPTKANALLDLLDEQRKRKARTGTGGI